MTTYFESAAAWRKWLAANHKAASEISVGFYKVGTKKPSMTWSESVDEALCYGWIDGVRHRVDDERYTIRFTPRKPTSNWSRVNIEKMAKLEAEKKMRKAGRDVFAKRSLERSAIYGYENETVALDAAMLKRFRADKPAWADWKKRPAGYQKLASKWVMTAKRAETRARRFETLLECSRTGEKIPPQRYG